MKKKLIGILVMTLLIAAIPGIAAQSIFTKPQNQTPLNEPLTIEPLTIKKVKEIPVPWQFWEEFPQEGVLDVIVLPVEVERPVAIVRAYAVLYQEIPLDDLLWINTFDLQMMQIDDPQDPYILEPGGQVEYFIPTNPYIKAVIVRYSVAWADTPDVIEVHFVNEVILQRNTILGSLSNFDVHNDYSKPINNFELELYGGIEPSDVNSWYDVTGVDPALVYEDYPPYIPPRYVWYYGWGAPPRINGKPYGTEIVWIDVDRPVKTCNWFHCGVDLKSDVDIRGARAWLTIFTKNPYNEDTIVESKVTSPSNQNSQSTNQRPAKMMYFEILQRLQDIQ